MALTQEHPIVEVLRLFERNDQQICLVVDGQDRLVGTVTDGDVRRGLLRNLTLSAPLSLIMNATPLSVSPDTSTLSLIRLMHQHGIRYIPAVTEDGRVVTLHGLKDLTMPMRDNWVVLMAGGEGLRLRPLTENCPKPMIPVGDKPILERILEEFIEQGFHRFFISINYLGNIIREHFGDGSRWNVDIRYMEERSKMGTAGSLALLPERPANPILVMNGDLLTRLNFKSMLDFHVNSGHTATVGVRAYTVEIPYGVVAIENDRINAMIEKPMHKHFINCGVYTLDPSCLDRLPLDQPTDMPHLLQSLINTGCSVGSFPIHEYWIDIGRMSDLERANQEYQQLRLSGEAVPPQPRIEAEFRHEKGPGLA